MLYEVIMNELDHFKITRSMRDTLLTILVDYYQLHFDNLGEIKSLKVLKELFEWRFNRPSIVKKHLNDFRNNFV